jgi:hypothetical protein
MVDDGFGQDEYGQPYNSMGFVLDDKFTDEKKKKRAHDKEVEELLKNAWSPAAKIKGVDDNEWGH